MSAEGLPAAGSARGPRIPGFELLGVLGTGAGGVVYKARIEKRRGFVALKVMPSHVAKNPVLVERLMREARAASVIRHENIVQGVDIGEAGGVHYFAMEYVEGLSLAQVLKERGAIPEEEALAIAGQMASAIAAASKAGILHRDIKPSNILIAGNGKAKLADLGLAKDVRDEEEAAVAGSGGVASLANLPAGGGTLTRTGLVMGTPQYMSPEQVKSQKDLDVRTDIYALGSTLYHAVAGFPAYNGETVPDVLGKVLAGAWPPLREARPEISEAFEGLVRRMMALRPEDRFQSAAELLDAIEGARQGVIPEMPEAAQEAISELQVLPVLSAPERRPAPSAPRRRLAASRMAAKSEGARRGPIAVLVILLFAVAAVFALNQRTEPTPEAPAAAPKPKSATPNPLPELPPEPETPAEDAKFASARIVLESLPGDLEGLRSVLVQVEPLAALPETPKDLAESIRALKARIADEEKAAEIAAAAPEPPAPAPEPSPGPALSVPPTPVAPIPAPTPIAGNLSPPADLPPGTEPQDDSKSAKPGGKKEKKEREKGKEKERKAPAKQKAREKDKEKAGELPVETEPTSGRGKRDTQRDAQRELAAQRDEFLRQWQERVTAAQQQNPDPRAAQKAVRDLRQEYRDYMQKFNDEWDRLGGRTGGKMKGPAKEAKESRKGGN
ncbi:MAG: serine/threonine-protein kinase [Planctomycetota bacterium]